jgi:glycosidase
MLENHDTQRFNQTYPDFRKYQMGLALIATIRGIPQIYAGSEIGMRGDKKVGDHDIRRDFPGGWNGDANNAFTKSGRTAEQQQYFDYTSKLFNWRKNKNVLHSGKMTHYIPENNVYVYFRYDEKETVMVVINNSDTAQTLKTARFAENIKNFRHGKNIMTGQTADLTKDITADPKSVLILELEK